MSFTVNRNFSSGSDFVAFFISYCKITFAICYELADKCVDFVNMIKKDVHVYNQEPGALVMTKHESFVFSGKVYIYYEGISTLKKLGELESKYNSKNLHPHFRSTGYFTTLWLQENPSTRKLDSMKSS